MFPLGIHRLGVILLPTIVACSDDDSNDDRTAGAAGAGGSASSSGGSANGPGGGAGTTGGTGMYSVAQTCEMFAAVTCAKAAECGLVLDETPTQIVCVDCTDAALAIIAEGCAGDLDGPKDAASLDRCLASMGASSCTEACTGADMPDCDVIDELSGEEGGEPVVCDTACASG
jgi:hypothetical protein